MTGKGTVGNTGDVSQGGMPEELKNLLRAAPKNVSQEREHQEKMKNLDVKQFEDIRRAEEARLKREELKAQRAGISIEDGSPRHLVSRSMAEVQIRAIEWLWIGWIARKYINLFVGESGAAKSTVLADIVARITTGRPWPGETETRPPGRVIWLGSEDGAEDMTVPRLMACGADLSRVIEIRFAMQGGSRATFSMQDDIGSVKEGLKCARDEQKDPFVMLVIDPITSYLPGRKLRKVDMNDTGQIRSILEPWFDVAQEYNLAIASVTHFNKDTSRAMLHRVTGSAVFGQTCRSLCAMVARGRWTVRKGNGAGQSQLAGAPWRRMEVPHGEGDGWRGSY